MIKFTRLLHVSKSYSPALINITSKQYHNLNKPIIAIHLHKQCNALFNNKCLSTIEEKLEEPKKTSLLAKVLSKLPFIDIEKSQLSVTAYMLYESIADKINYMEFFEEFSLPDTFYSWFVVTELHIWMLMVRCMAENEDGRFVRNKIVEALWADVGLRVKKLGAANPAGTRAQVAELSEQLQAALIAYDEGLQSDDRVLAGAIWRRLYQQKEVDPEHLDLLIKYIRRQIRNLDNISRNELFSQKSISWESKEK